MSEPASQLADRPLTATDMVTSVVVVFWLAITQPLLDLLGGNAEFFIARAATSMDIVLVGVLSAIVLPLIVAGIVVGIARLHAGAGRVVHVGILVVLGGAAVAQILERTPADVLPWGIEFLVSFGAGALLALAIVRSASLRTFLRYASVAPVVSLVMFLFLSPSSQLLTSDGDTSAVAVDIAAPAPVVMVVFDEFPVASLMDAEGDLQEDVYPNFARLARDGTWFRNATTVQQQTERALPAILTGTDPGERDAVPSAAAYPANLFTLLADDYELDVREAVTELCPAFACGGSSRPAEPFADRWRLLTDDLRVVVGHLVLPEDLAAETLPPIDSSWSNFAAAENAEDWNIIGRFNEQAAADRRIPVAGFLDAIDPPGERPELDFVHALLPHVPWSYLRTGQTYPAPSPAPGSASPGWGGDEWLVDQAYQQHLVQVTYVDALIGDMIERLEATGQYDDALIVVLADHGISVRPDIPHRRVAYPDTVGDIAAVPLFIKRPNDPGVGVDDYRAETVDVLPTIADVLGIELPWATDGVSLFDPDRPDRSRSQITGDEGVIVFGVDGSEARAIASRKVDHFGPAGPYGLAPAGHRDLLGAAVADLDVDPDGGVRATVTDHAAFASVDIDGESLPARVRGVLPDGTGSDADVIIAVAVNGEIAAVTRTEHTEDGTVRYGAMIPPPVLVDGSNDVQVLLVKGEGEFRTFHETTR
jgi:hypothetical protein